MKQYQITLKGRTFDVKVLDDPRQEKVRVEVDGETFTVGVESVSEETREPAPTVPSAVPGPAPQASGQVVAPLPGVVKAVTARLGQQVAEGEAIVVIEAMKMENVIRAPRAGTVNTIYVSEGRQVAYGDPLLDLV
jgi:biotin carboxyl carrier protein